MEMSTNPLDLSLERLQTSQGEDVIYAAFARTDGRPRGELFLKPSVVASPGRLYNQLLDKGANLPPRKEAIALLEAAIASIPMQAGHLLDGPGWHGSIPTMCFVLPDETIGQVAGLVIMSDRAKADCAAKGLAGTLEDWKSEVALPVARSGVAGVAMLTVLASPLLKFAALSENFVVNMFGNSSAGKTSGNLAAASIFGDPMQIPSWNASTTGLAQWTSANSDLPLIPDDAERASEDPGERLKKLHALTHFLTGNRSKKYARAVSGPDQLQVGNFRSLVLSSSPDSIEQAASRTDGDRVRWFDIPVPHGNVGGIWASYDGGAPPNNTAEFSERLVEAAKRSHGHAGRAFLRYLVKHQVELPSRIERYTARFLTTAAGDANSVEGRIARKFGLLYAAGMIARNADILPWTKDDVMGIVAFGFRSAVSTAFGGNFDRAKAISGLSSQLNDRAMFPRITSKTLSTAKPVPDAQGYVWKDGDRVYIRLTALPQLLSNAGAGSPSPSDVNALLVYFRSEGALLKGHGVHPTRDIRIGGTRPKLLEFRLKKLGAVLSGKKPKTS